MINFFKLNLLLHFLFLCNAQVQAQQNSIYSDSLKNKILLLDQKVNDIQLNLGKSYKKSKLGILTATLGYTITIAGGQMLGGSNNDLGEAFLYIGGAVGITGTAILIDSFNYIGRAAGKKRKKRR